MARIIEASDNGRKIIKLTTDDILSVVKEYQRIVPRSSNYLETRDYLENNVIFIPEDI